MPELRVLIVGASIAGPTAAYWFAKAGASVTVIERFPHLRPGGQSIDIRTVGVTVMRRMQGMEDAVRANLAPIEGISFVDDDGRPYGTMRSTGDPDQQSLVSEFEIFRGDLSRILVDMSKEQGDVRYVFGEQILSMRYEKGDDGPVTVEFMNGSATAEYDLVVACDGANSRTRAMALGCGVRDHVTPTGSFAAYFSAKDGIKRSKIGQAFTAPGGRFIAVGPDHQEGISRFVFMGVNLQPENPVVLSLRKALSQGDDALKTFLAEHYRDGGWIFNDAVEYMLKSEDLYTSEIVQVKVPNLYNKRVVLVGDAGYGPGPTGTGTSLAIAGAYVLAGEIQRHRGDLATGLKSYEERMRPIAEDLGKMTPWLMSIISPQTSLGIWMRNVLFGGICWAYGVLGPVFRLVQRYAGSAFESGEKHSLEDYDFDHRSAETDV